MARDQLPLWSGTFGFHIVAFTESVPTRTLRRRDSESQRQPGRVPVAVAITLAGGFAQPEPDGSTKPEPDGSTEPEPEPFDRPVAHAHLTGAG